MGGRKLPGDNGLRRKKSQKRGKTQKKVQNNFRGTPDFLQNGPIFRPKTEPWKRHGLQVADFQSLPNKDFTADFTDSTDAPKTFGVVRVIGEICGRIALAGAGRAVPVCEPVFVEFLHRAHEGAWILGLRLWQENVRGPPVELVFRASSSPSCCRLAICPTFRPAAYPNRSSSICFMVWTSFQAEHRLKRILVNSAMTFRSGGPSGFCASFME
jgi:hypothetical protein